MNVGSVLLYIVRKFVKIYLVDWFIFFSMYDLRNDHMMPKLLKVNNVFMREKMAAQSKI